MAEVVLVVHEGVLIAMGLPGGQVWRWARQRSRSVERIAKDLAPYKTGRLMRSIASSYTPGPPHHVFMDVSSNVGYAVFPHEGTRPHIIRPRNPAGRLQFFWTRRAKVFVGRPGQAVNHPGIRNPTPFLADALHIVMRRL